MTAQIFADFANWWTIRFPKAILTSIKITVLVISHFLSLQTNLKYFFVPWKNERRPGYVGIAIGIGITIRTMIIVINILLVSITALTGVFLLIAWYSAPILIFFIPTPVS